MLTIHRAGYITKGRIDGTKITSDNIIFTETKHTIELPLQIIAICMENYNLHEIYLNVG